MAPGLAWLALFFVLPNIQMLLTSLSNAPAGRPAAGLRAHLVTFEQLRRGPDRVPVPAPQLARLRRAGHAAVLPDRLPARLRDRLPRRALQDVLLFLVIAPFFTSFLIRTISWRIMLGNDGPLLGSVRDTLGLVPGELQHPQHAAGGRLRADLPVPAVHGPARCTSSLEKIDRASSRRPVTCTPGRGGRAVRSSAGSSA